MSEPIQRRSSESREHRMGDLELDGVVRRAALGEADAFEDLYRRFASRILALCRRMLGSREAAEDATSEIFMRLQRSITTYDGSVPFEHWLMRVASHRCVDLLRRRQVQQRWIVDSETDSFPDRSSALSPLAEAITKERSAELREAIDRLSPTYRTVLVLRYFADLSYDEIAQQLGLKRPTVASQILRAKQELRHALAPHRGKP